MISSQSPKLILHIGVLLVISTPVDQAFVEAGESCVCKEAVELAVYKSVFRPSTVASVLKWIIYEPA